MPRLQSTFPRLAARLRRWSWYPLERLLTLRERFSRFLSTLGGRTARRHLHTLLRLEHLEERLVPYQSTTSLSALIQPSSCEENALLTATVSGTHGLPTGSVYLLDNGAWLGPPTALNSVPTT